MKINYIRICERIFHVHIMKQLAHGVDFFCDIKLRLPNYKMDYIFDVGANVGQSSQWFLKRMPCCKIWAFEPVFQNYAVLSKRLSSIKSIKCFQVALGEVPAKAQMHLSGLSSHISVTDHNSGESIEVQTLDNFCVEHSIEKIHFLKIDTEGHDLFVLKGSFNMLSEQRIDFIQVEVGMNPGNTFHVPFEEMKIFLEKFDYRIFGIYDQVQEWPTSLPILRRVNSIFVSKRIFEMKNI